MLASLCNALFRLVAGTPYPGPTRHQPNVELGVGRIPTYLLSILMTEHYELLAIFPGTQTEEEAQASATKLQDALKEQGASVTHHDFWGKRKLAYEIKHIRHGYYDVTEFDLDPAAFSKLDNSLRLNEVVLRHQIVQKILKTPEQLAAEAALRERIAAKRQAAREKEQASVFQEEVETPTEAAPAGPIEKEKLEEKIEEILGSDKVEI